MEHAQETILVFSGRKCIEIELAGDADFEVFSMRIDPLRSAPADALDGAGWEAWFCKGDGEVSVVDGGFQISATPVFGLVLSKNLEGIDAGRFHDFEFGGLPPGTAARVSLYLATGRVNRRLALDGDELRAGSVDLAKLADERFGAPPACLVKRIEIELAGKGGSKGIFLRRPSLWGKPWAGQRSVDTAPSAIDGARLDVPTACGVWTLAGTLRPGRHALDIDGGTLLMVKRSGPRAPDRPSFKELAGSCAGRYAVRFAPGGRGARAAAGPSGTASGLYMNGKRYRLANGPSPDDSLG